MTHCEPVGVATIELDREALWTCRQCGETAVIRDADAGLYWCQDCHEWVESPRTPWRWAFPRARDRDEY